MATPQEIEQLLNKVQKANEELKQTVQEAHVARRDLVDDFKKHKTQIAEQITKEVTLQVQRAGNTCVADMRLAAEAAIEQVVVDWRRALKLDA